jgi:hypothetical protein
MSKAKAAALVGALSLCGLVVLTSLAVAAGRPALTKLHGAFISGCAKEAAHTPIVLPDGGDPREAFFDACFLLVRALKVVSPSNSDFVERFLAAFVAEIANSLDDLAKTFDLTPTGDPCDDCVIVVQEFESFLAANATVPSIALALQAGCEKRFLNPTEADECRQIVETVPVLVDLLLSNFPPLVLCRQLNICPL